MSESYDIEHSLRVAKEMAAERQPIRYDTYLQHIGYYESCIQTLQSIIKRLYDQGLIDEFCNAISNESLKRYE